MPATTQAAARWLHRLPPPLLPPPLLGRLDTGAALRSRHNSTAASASHEKCCPCSSSVVINRIIPLDQPGQGYTHQHVVAVLLAKAICARDYIPHGRMGIIVNSVLEHCVSHTRDGTYTCMHATIICGSWQYEYLCARWISRWNGPHSLGSAPFERATATSLAPPGRRCICRCGASGWMVGLL